MKRLLRRWLAVAWDDGYEACEDSHHGLGFTDNPYRKRVS